MISLVMRSAITVPGEGETITPQAFHGKRVAEIEALPVLLGNATARLDDFFSVRRLLALGFPVPEGLLRTPRRRYSDDFIELGKGEILVWTSA